ncbi:MAG: DUF885 domain-containing protein [Lachnospiraceae bacterium]|nr:DUF885 domain-containing protein [Lachnospiraceae bacterium]
MQKHRLLHTLPLCFLLLFAGCTNDPSVPPEHSGYVSGIPTPTPTFDEFAMDIFLEEVTTDTISLRYSLSQPENYGVADYPITLGSIEDAISPDEDALTLYEQLLNYDTASLSTEEQLTYEALKHHLDLTLQDEFSPYLSELLGPTTGYQAQLPIILAEYRFETIEDVEHYLDLLPCIYDYFKEIAEFEQKKSAAGYFMDDETAKEIIAQCEDFVKNPDDHFLISTFRERLEGLDLSLSQKTEYILENQNALYSAVFPAYDLLAETLTGCLGTGTNKYGLCYFEHGKDYYALLTAISTGTDKTMEELKQALSSAITSGCNTMAIALAEDPALYDNALEPDYPETDPELIIEYITAQSANDFPHVNCGEYNVKYIPKALEDYVSPAMYLVPPIDQFESGVIYINGNSRYDAEALFPTIAHEGYPGHLYQTVATLSGDIHPLRYLLSSTGYEEGWATYVETYSYKYANFSSALTSFLQADQTATLCLYALSDIFIHYDGYTPEQLSTFLTSYGFPKESSDLIYQTLLAEPGAYLPYAVGYLEFMELKQQAEQNWGGEYSDYRFHEFLLETGPMPFGILEELLENY